MELVTEKLNGCPCVTCKESCNWLGYCPKHAAWLENERVNAQRRLEDMNRLSRMYIKVFKKGGDINEA